MNKTLELPAVFSDGCIIRHGIETTVWGMAASGSTVSLKFAGHTVTAQAPNGRFKTRLPAVPPGGPYDLVVSDGEEQVVIRDILAGEVWIAGGQSNMEWPLKTTKGYREHIAAADYPQIRFFNVQKLLYDGETEDNPDKFSRTSAWRQAVPEHVGEFSAVGYHFARDLHSDLNMPIGIIECNLGGSSASAWTREDYLSRDPDVKSYLDEYQQAVEKLDMDQYNSAVKMLMAGMSSMMTDMDPEIEMDQPFEFSDLPPEMLSVMQIAIGPGPRAPFGYPGSLYRNMVQTFAPYTASGVIFYQGESDDIKARIYSKLFTLMIDCWRETFENPDLPFVFAQLSAYSREGNPDGDMYAILRDQQFQVSRTVKRTGMAVTMDVGSFFDIHPRRKEPVGQRLAKVALEKVYGKPIESSGPVYRSVRIEGSRMILEFDHAASGLVCQGEMLKGFKICGANRLYHEAKAKIEDGNVVISSPQVAMPAAASYGWANYCEVNLYNREGLPAVPFKTDRYL